AAGLVLYGEERGAGSGQRYRPERDQFLTQVAAPVVFVRTKADVDPPSAGPTVRPSVAVSVVTGEGLADLRRKLAEVAYGRLLALGDVEPVVTRARHRGALERALAEVDAFHTARGSGVDAACEYDARVAPAPAAARGPEFAARATNRGGAGANGRHIVTFRGQIPVDFDAQVEAMGGKVLWASPGSRLAAVRGLSAAAAAALAGNQSIAAVDADVLVSLEMPKLSAVDAGDVAGVQSADNPAGAVR